MTGKCCKQQHLLQMKRSSKAEGVLLLLVSEELVEDVIQLIYFWQLVNLARYSLLKKQRR